MAAEGAIWQAEGEAKRARVQSLFAAIAPKYDRLNALLSLRMHHRWRALAVRQLALQHGETALDVCCGTGDFLAPLTRAVGASGLVLGLDFCGPMLAIAARKSASPLVLGDACRLPVSNDCVQGATVGWGIRNVPDIDEAHREIFRVLRPGASFVSVDMSVPRNKVIASASRLLCQRLIPWLGSLFGQREAYTYLPESTLLFWDRKALIESMERAGFVNCAWKDLMFGNICLHWGSKPE